MVSTVDVPFSMRMILSRDEVQKKGWGSVAGQSDNGDCLIKNSSYMESTKSSKGEYIDCGGTCA